MLCANFTPDDYADECCKSFAVFGLADFTFTNPLWDFEFGDEFSIRLEINRIIPEEIDSPCQWQLTSDELYLNETYPVDRPNGGCLTPPTLEISGVTVQGCAGTIVITVFEPVKIPFVNAHPEIADAENEVTIPETPYPICDCSVAANYLCVGGVRHADGPTEYVRFAWNSTLNDRWEYCPPGLTAGECNGQLLREIIYLRGDSYGNCWLELDFEQTGGDTNDWADPPNNYDGENPHDIRDGMIPIEQCGCGIFAQGTSTEGRSIRIHSGSCARYTYACGTCRCVPQTLCVIGSFDGEMFRGSAEWDGSGWQSNDGYLPFRLVLGSDDAGNCVMNVESDYSLGFEPSLPIDCGNFLQSENSAIHDPDQPLKYAFIWASSAMCSSCASSVNCGPCRDRCGQSPETLYLTITEGIRDPDPYDMIDLGAFECTYDVTLQFWSRGFTGTECGYIGESFYTCEGITYRVVVTSGPSPSFRIQVKMYDTSTNELARIVDYNHDLGGADTCEPYSFEREFNPPPASGGFYSISVIE